MRFIFFDTFNNVSVIYHISAVGRVFRNYVLCHVQYSVIYNTFAVGRGVQESHVLSHFQYSVIYHTFAFAVGRGVQDAHVLCHFQYCFSNLPHMCYRQGVNEAHVF